MRLTRCQLHGCCRTAHTFFLFSLTLLLLIQPENVSSSDEKSGGIENPIPNFPTISSATSASGAGIIPPDRVSKAPVRTPSQESSQLLPLTSFSHHRENGTHKSLIVSMTVSRNPSVKSYEESHQPVHPSKWVLFPDEKRTGPGERSLRNRRDLSPANAKPSAPPAFADATIRSSSTESIYADEERKSGDDHHSEGAVWLSSFPPGATCRTQIRSSRDLPPLAFQLTTCAYCYKYMLDESSLFGNPSKKLQSLGPTIVQNMTVLGLLTNDKSSVVIANISDPENPLYGTFANPDAENKWVDCCRAAERCCKRIAKLPYPFPVSAGLAGGPGNRTCPSNWDGWQCWDEAPAGTVAEEACPHYIFFKSEPPSCLTHVPKYCDADGQWQKKNLSGILQDWTNYTACAAAVVEVQKKRVHVHIMAYAVSIIALTPAIIIFFSYKQLRVQRTILHQNLFISMFINAIFVILFKTIVILNELEGDRTLINQNGIGCRLLFILTKYLRMTNYMWMFCEGYYLHKLFAAAFAEQKSLLVFYLLGWAFPVIPTGIYAGLRMYGADDRCWVVPEEIYEWVLNFPSMLSLLINLGFLCNILRVIWTKIKTTHQQYTKALRAVLLLLPLFGLHFVVTIYRPPSSSGCEWIELYYYVNYVLDGLQGWLVALNFCYVNSEVLALIKRSYTLWKEQREMGMQRTQSRSNHRGHAGHSMVSSYYSSVPDSPEPRRLNGSKSLSTSVEEATKQAEAKGSNLTNGKSNNVGTMVLTSIQEDSGNPNSEGWTEITLNVHAPNENSLELKQAFTLSPVAKSGRKSPKASAKSTSNAGTGSKNGAVVEHQL